MLILVFELEPDGLLLLGLLGRLLLRLRGDGGLGQKKQMGREKTDGLKHCVDVFKLGGLQQENMEERLAAASIGLEKKKRKG